MNILQKQNRMYASINGHEEKIHWNLGRIKELFGSQTNINMQN